MTREEQEESAPEAHPSASHRLSRREENECLMTSPYLSGKIYCFRYELRLAATSRQCGEETWHTVGIMRE